MSKRRKTSQLRPGDCFTDPDTLQQFVVDEEGQPQPWAPEPYDPWKEIGADLRGGREVAAEVRTDLPRRADGTIAPAYALSPEQLQALGQDLPGRHVRHDGWTLERQRNFLERLATSASVTDAARSVGMSRQSARGLYHRSPAFRAAWDEALRASISVLAETAFDRAVNGVQEQVWYKGEMVGFREKYNDRLLMFLLRVRDPLNFAPLDDLQGWQRHRSLADQAAFPKALDRLTEAEEKFGDPRLPLAGGTGGGFAANEAEWPIPAPGNPAHT